MLIGSVRLLKYFTTVTRNGLRSGEEYPYHDNLSVQCTGEVTKLDTGVEVVITDRTVVNWVGIIH